MKPFTTRLFCFLGVLLSVGTAAMALADNQPNPFQAIPERNAFGLRPPPPPVDNTPPPPVVPLAKVVLTGTTTILHKPRALLEITDQEPGKQPTTRKPIMREGERDGSIEVVKIDIEKNVVKILNAGIETNLTFEVPKLTGAPAVPGFPGGIPPPPLTTPVPNAFGQPNAAANPAAAAAGRPTGGMSVYGATPSAARPVTPNYTPPTGGYTPPTPGAAYDATGLRSIPTRSVRADSSLPPVPPSPPRVPVR